jgi:membrane protein YqaA with SNARE-associated domain
MDEREKAEEVSLKPLIIRGVVVTALIFAAVWIIGHYVAEPAEHLADLIVENLGIWGIFLAVLAADALTLPIPPDTYLLAAVASDTDAITIVNVVAVASVIAGSLAYLVGPIFERFAFLRKRIDKVRPQGEALFAKYGTWTIVVASLTPLPFSVTCWIAGIYRMPYRPFFLATLARIPRFWLYYLMFEFGWTM